MTLPLRARLVILGLLVGALCVLGLVFRGIAQNGLPGRDALMVASVVGVLITLSWMWPLIVHIDSEAEAVHLDEAFLVMLVLLVPPGLAVLTFALATLVAQVLRRRPMWKTAFNFGSVVLSVVAGTEVFKATGLVPGHVGYLELGAGLAAALAYFSVNWISMRAIFVATGVPWQRALKVGLGVREMLVGSGVIVSLGASILVSAHIWALPIALAPLLILRQVLAGHFAARQDRMRLQSLY